MKENEKNQLKKEEEKIKEEYKALEETEYELDNYKKSINNCIDILMRSSKDAKTKKDIESIYQTSSEFIKSTSIGINNQKDRIMNSMKEIEKKQEELNKKNEE